jgi:hypothetical protein
VLDENGAVQFEQAIRTASTWDGKTDTPATNPTNEAPEQTAAEQVGLVLSCAGASLLGVNPPAMG